MKIIFLNNSSFSVINFNLIAISNCVSSSEREPDAMFKNCINSKLDFRPAPSAILEGIETALLFI